MYTFLPPFIDIDTIVAVRVLLGLFEAGMYPGIVYYISRYTASSCG